MNLEIKNPTFGEDNYDEYNNYDEFGSFESLDTVKKKGDNDDSKIIDINANTEENLVDTMSYEFNNELEKNTLDTSNSLTSTLELDQLEIAMNIPNDEIHKKTAKRKKTTREINKSTGEKENKKPTKVKKLNQKKDDNIENYRYAA